MCQIRIICNHRSCVNRDVRKTNKRLQEFSEKYNNVPLVEARKAERFTHKSGSTIQPSRKDMASRKDRISINHQEKGWMPGEVR